MTAPRRRFEVVAPDWGQTHLTSDAVVAFVDDELSPAAHRRATAHVEACPACAAEVAVQRQARAVLRSACAPELSSALLHALRTIPQDAELPGPPPGLAVGPDGRLGQALRTTDRAADRASSARTRFAMGFAGSALAVGTLALTVTFLPAEPDERAPGAAQAGGVLQARLQAQPATLPVEQSQPPERGAAGGERPGMEHVLRQLDVLPVALHMSR